jgi:hypothetical protein
VRLGEQCRARSARATVEADQLSCLLCRLAVAPFGQCGLRRGQAVHPREVAARGKQWREHRRLGPPVEQVELRDDHQDRNRESPRALRKTVEESADPREHDLSEEDLAAPREACLAHRVGELAQVFLGEADVEPVVSGEEHDCVRFERRQGVEEPPERAEREIASGQVDDVGVLRAR